MHVSVVQLISGCKTDGTDPNIIQFTHILVVMRQPF
jgi:hypothetical protein